VEQELKIAREIQTHLLPTTPPEIPGLPIAGLMIPATEVGGDYYDFVLSRDDKTLYLALGDVSGKGVPASLVMVMARCFLQPLVDHAPSTHEILREINRLLLRDTRPGIFMSFLIVAYDLESRSLTWSAAGQEHLLVRRAATGRVEAIKAGGIALGIVPSTEQSYPEHSLLLEPGDSVLLYTDGVPEALDPAERALGFDATRELLARHGDLDVGSMIERIYGGVQEHMGGAPPHDDITMIGIRKC
jgi:sigma-B regulation protein RsbU (phosphoserine phosphatase)